MVFKKIYILVLILLWALGSYFYLQEKYNPYTVEVYLDSPVSYGKVRDVAIKNRTRHHVINYSMTYIEGRLVMTTGQDGMFQSMKLLNGSFITNEREQVVVIGDYIADKYFRTTNVIGRKLPILGEEFLIIGVIPKSRDYFFSYQEDLLDQRWDHITFKYEPDNHEHLDIRVRDMSQALRRYEIMYSDMTIYRDRMQDYINYMIISIVGIFIIFLVRPYRWLQNQIKSLWVEYQKQRVRLEWYKFIHHYNKTFFKIMLLVFGGFLSILGIFHLVKFIKIPELLFPDNLFSPTSYFNMFRNIYNLWIQRMYRGVTSILIDTVLIHLGLLFGLVTHLLIWVYYRNETLEPRGEKIED